jgi:lipopolysaccharide transport system ATP-binding protein
MSDSDPIITVDNLSKAYRIWETPAARLKSPLLTGAASMFPKNSAPHRALHARAARGWRDFYALHDVSFTVRRGEAVGIIGRNGSGKSTLLQIIAGTLQPTAGKVHVAGRVNALLELGSGFNPDFTGRENVYLAGAILGFSERQINERFITITAFADIGDFIDQPVKTYSSGMMMRLAFAVQTTTEPNILIIDEALSVGDAPFQAKCFARLRHLQDRGCTILFVSHDVGVVRSFCQKAIWIKQGRIEAQGNVSSACDTYQRECERATGIEIAEYSPSSTSLASNTAGPTQQTWLAADRTVFEHNASLQRIGNGPLKMHNFFLVNERVGRTSAFHWDETVTAVCIITAPNGYKGYFQIGVLCKNLQGIEILSTSDRTHSHELDLLPGETQVVTLRFRLPLRGGKYYICTGLFTFPSDARFPHGTYDFTRSTLNDRVEFAAFIEIEPQFNLSIYGPVHEEAIATIE